MTETKKAAVHVRELLADSLTPLAVYRRLAKLSKVRFLLESVSGGEQVSRFSFLGTKPREIYRLWPDRLEVTRSSDPGKGSAHTTEVLPGEPLDALRRELRRVRSEPGPIPFTGGLVGFFGFDLVRMIEHLPNRPPDHFGLPIAAFGRFDTVVVFDHARQRVLAIANEIEDEVSMAEAEDSLRQLSEILTSDGGTRAVAMPVDQQYETAPTSRVSMSGPEYRAAVEKAKEYIRAGDIFQVVIGRRWTVPQAPGPLALYRALRMVNPSPYMVLLELPDAALVGASPEMLVRKAGLRVENRPIAGTRPRGVDEEGDRRLAEDLLSDAKERAEHVMLVDLGRNDVGKVAAPGTVKVSSFMEVEHYSHVMHLVSSVVGDLDLGRDGLDALLACFPAGTLSGAPKIRALEIIDELEPEARGPYGGAVGYFSYSGDVDTCITIRTLVVKDGETSVSAGAGLVADSDPAAEERETENKAAGLLAAVSLAQQLEAAERVP
ncbi:MAG: anthranilate synthase component I [Thermoanaerobaculia bacterium]|nr:anthranilate synthase component I [Thermoanaerobaculia bacterium]